MIDRRGLLKGIVSFAAYLLVGKIPRFPIEQDCILEQKSLQDAFDGKYGSVMVWMRIEDSSGNADYIQPHVFWDGVNDSIPLPSWMKFNA